MTQTPPDAPASAGASRTQANSLLEVSPAFSNLGSTTATRSWVALAAVLLVLIASLAWGLFGQVTLQQTVGGIAVGNGLTLEISVPTSGRVTRLAPIGQLYSPGDEIATILPDDGSPEFTVSAPANMMVTGWQSVLGSPVTPAAPIGRGVVIGASPRTSGLGTGDALVAISFVPLSDYSVFANALSLEVVVMSPGKDPQTYPAKLEGFSRYPSSQARIAQLIGNPTLAADVTAQTGGEAHLVALGFANPEDAKSVADASMSGDPGSVTAGLPATIVITEVSDSPLKVLFGSGA